MNATRNYCTISCTIQSEEFGTHCDIHFDDIRLCGRNTVLNKVSGESWTWPRDYLQSISDRTFLMCEGLEITKMDTIMGTDNSLPWKNVTELYLFIPLSDLGHWYFDVLIWPAWIWLWDLEWVSCLACVLKDSGLLRSFIVINNIQWSSKAGIMSPQTSSRFISVIWMSLMGSGV